MRAGKLDRAITIERVSRDIGKAGEPIESWCRHAIRRAEVVVDAANDNSVDAGAVTRARLRLRIRWMPDLTFDDRIGFDGKVYEIASIAEIGRRKAIEIECVRVGDARP